MSIFTGRLGLALVLAALCPGGRTAHAQAAPVPYWNPGWPVGFGGNMTAGPGVEGSDARTGGFSYRSYNLPNSWSVGGEGSGMGLSMNGINQTGAFGNIRSYYEGVQFGYNFQNAPLTIYAGFDTLKYDAGSGGPFAPFDTMSGTLPGYRAHAGIEFQPAPNLSLSLGFGYTQLPGRIDSDINSLSANPFAPGGRR